MRLPGSGDGFDTEQINKMVDAFMERGYTYFDTAYVYRGSERAMNETLVTRYPRESYQIATKLNLGDLKSNDELIVQFNKSCERLGVDYVDFYLLHGIGGRTENKDEDLGAWDFLAKLKTEGKAKHIGFSFHGTPEKLDEILQKHPEAEFVQLQLNYIDWENEDVQAKRLYEVARSYDKPIVVMEPLKGGKLSGEDSSFAKMFKAANPSASPASWALRFVASLEGVLVVLSGMSSFAQMEDNLATVKDLKPLTESEMKTLGEAIDALNAVPRVPCTECGYCLEGCPQKIQIPKMMDIYSNYLVYQTTANSEHAYRFMAGPAAGTCVACGDCEKTCPQGIGIVDILARLSAMFDQ